MLQQRQLRGCTSGSDDRPCKPGRRGGEGRGAFQRGLELGTRVGERARTLFQEQPLEEWRQGGLRDQGVGLGEGAAQGRRDVHGSLRVQEHEGGRHPLEKRASDLRLVPREASRKRRSLRLGVQAAEQVPRDDPGPGGAVRPHLVCCCHEADTFCQRRRCGLGSQDDSLREQGIARSEAGIGIRRSGVWRLVLRECQGCACGQSEGCRQHRRRAGPHRAASVPVPCAMIGPSGHGDHVVVVRRVPEREPRARALQ